MASKSLEEIQKLKKINQALMDRVERSMDQQGQAFSLFQTAINLESQIDRRTNELTTTLAHLRLSNHELETAKNIAEWANISKTHFLAAASHDVLQPLNAASLLISSLTSLQTCDEGMRLCRQVESSLDTMSTLLRSLLYMSRLDAGDVRPNWQSVSLKNLFESIKSDFEPLAHSKHIEFRVKHKNLFVHSDPTMLRRIVQNIVANAINYTNTGGVLVVANKLKDKVHIRVADTGCGIEKQHFDDIFIQFSRHNPQQNEVAQEQFSAGLGLGLAIVRQMVDILKHEIHVNSHIGQGSCFHLAMLADEPPSKPAKAHNSFSASAQTRQYTVLTNTKILLIENDLLAQEAMTTLLKQWACESKVASNTQEALRQIARDSWRPDLIIADQHLDENDLGTATIELVRTLVGNNIPALIVTANPSKQLAQHAENNQIEVMLKPVKPAQLRALLTHLRSTT